LHPTGCVALLRRSRSDAPQTTSIMSLITIIVNVCERLFEELVKELLIEHYVVVSAHYRVVNGKKVRVRKAHLRKRKR